MYHISNIEQAILDAFRQLTETQQSYLLHFIKSMLPDRNEKSSNLARFAGIIDSSDLDNMRLSIQEDCGNIDLNEW